MLNVLLKSLVACRHFFFLHNGFCQSASNSLRAFSWQCSFFSTDVKSELDNLSKTMKNFEARVGFTKDLETISAVCCITLIFLADTIQPKA